MLVGFYGTAEKQCLHFCKYSKDNNYMAKTAV